MNIPSRTIDAVITHQFTEAFRATSVHNSIELSGFGKLMFSLPKARKQMEKYNQQLIAFNELLLTDQTEEQKRNTNMRIATVLKNIEHLKPKLI